VPATTGPPHDILGSVVQRIYDIYFQPAQWDFSSKHWYVLRSVNLVGSLISSSRTRDFASCERSPNETTCVRKAKSSLTTYIQHANPADKENHLVLSGDSVVDSSNGSADRTKRPRLHDPDDIGSDGDIDDNNDDVALAIRSNARPGADDKDSESKEEKRSNTTPPKPAAEGGPYSVTCPIRQPDLGTSLSQGMGSNVSYGGYAPDTTMGGISFAQSVEASIQSTGPGHNLASTSGGYGGFASASTNLAHQSLNPLPDDAQYVEVKLRIDEENRHFYRYYYGDEKREAEGWQWEKRMTSQEGQVLECYINTRQNGLHFWTWTLDPSVVQRVDGKRSKGKGRAH
jgi:hypothetical protein